MALYVTSRSSGAGGGSGSGVTSLNGETGAINLVAGGGIVITPSGQSIFISATGSSGSTELPSADLYDPLSTILPTSSPLAIDGIQVITGTEVLFANLSSGANQVYQATVTGPTISWTLLTPFNGAPAPSAGSLIVITQGVIYNNQLSEFNGVSWSFSQIPQLFTSITLSDNTTANVFSIPYANAQNLIVDYSLVRNGTKEAGQLLITTDGSTVGVSSLSSATLPNGVLFSGLISGSNLILQYTTTSVGVAGTLSYAYTTWSDTPGGPGVLHNATLANNTASGTVFSRVYSGAQNMLVYYSVIRSGVKECGIITLTTDGSTVGISSVYSSTAPTGVTFSSIISGSNIVLQYNTTNTGVSATMTYNLQSWSDTPGGVNGLNGATLKDNTSNGVFFSKVFLNSENMIIDYAINRGGVKDAGIMTVTTDGVNAAVSTESSSTGDIGVTFNATVSGNIVTVLYTTTSTGSSASATYSIQSWSDSPGSASSLIRFNGGGASASAGVGGTPAGSDTQIQFNQAGSFGASANLAYDYVNNVFLLGSKQVSALTSTPFLDNQVSPVVLFSMPATFNSVYLQYTVIRGTAVRTGTMQIATDGTISISNDEFYAESQPTGITFSVTLSGGNININYTTTATGSGGTYKYAFERW